MRHPDWYEDWPQSGERVRGHDAYRRIHENYPAGMPHVDVPEIQGAEDRWVMTPSMTIQRVANIERAQMLVESHSRKALQGFLAAWQPVLFETRRQAEFKSLVRWAIDVDPIAI